MSPRAPRKTEPSGSSASPPPAAPPAADIPLASADEQRRVLLHLRLDRSQIPPFFREKSLNNFETGGDAQRKQMLQMARAYLDSFDQALRGEVPPGAILYGPTGSGKTHIMVGILRELLSRGHEALFYSVPNLFKDLRKTFDKEENVNEGDLIDEISGAEILALDDLGAEMSSDWVKDRLYLIINRRYENCRPTLVTTNHAWPGDVERAIGRRIASRLAEMCQKMGPFPDKDWRFAGTALKRRLT